jgi:hypothetical protein
MQTQAVIFSKDRALQLQGTISSLVARCSDIHTARLSVIYKASSPSHAQAYERLQQELKTFCEINWVQERSFKKDLVSTVLLDNNTRVWRSIFARRSESGNQAHLLFMVDDNLFIGDFRLETIVGALAKFPNSLGFSLRVGRNTTYCYSNRCAQPLPDFEMAGEGILRFHWPGETGDFGYPLEVSSSVYRVRDIDALLRKLPYGNPNRLEQGLSVSSRFFANKKSELLCFDRSVAFCAPVNKVQRVVDNRAGTNAENSVDALNSLFMAGYRIDAEALKDFVSHAAHQELELPLTKDAV